MCLPLGLDPGLGWYPFVNAGRTLSVPIDSTACNTWKGIGGYERGGSWSTENKRKREQENQRVHEWLRRDRGGKSVYGSFLVMAEKPPGVAATRFSATQFVFTQVRGGQK